MKVKTGIVLFLIILVGLLTTANIWTARNKKDKELKQCLQDYKDLEYNLREQLKYIKLQENVQVAPKSNLDDQMKFLIKENQKLKSQLKSRKVKEETAPIPEVVKVSE